MDSSKEVPKGFRRVGEFDVCNLNLPEGCEVEFKILLYANRDRELAVVTQWFDVDGDRVPAASTVQLGVTKGSFMTEMKEYLNDNSRRVYANGKLVENVIQLESYLIPKSQSFQRGI